MQNQDYDCESLVIMEELGIGADELFQYARSVLPQREIKRLLTSLETLLASPGSEPAPGAEFYGLVAASDSADLPGH